MKNTRLSFNSFGRLSVFVGLIVASLFLAGCVTFSNTPKPVQPLADTNSVSNVPNDPLRVGDKVRIELTGTPIAIPYVDQAVRDDGTVALAKIGSIQAAGKTPRQLESDIYQKYVPDYYVDITVNVTPFDRFIWVGGMVNTPGQQVYSGAVTVSKAIQAAGDFNNFANKKRIQITRIHGKVEFVNYNAIRKHPELDLPIYPGDRIDVDRRW